MKAVIMAGGEGTRLRPLTTEHPKPMVPIVNKPVMAHILDLLHRNGINDVVIALHYLPDAVRGYFGSENGEMHIEYSVEEHSLGTAGSVRLTSRFLQPEPFLVVSGDALTDFDLTRAVEFHKERNAIVTVLLYRVPVPLDYGVVVTDEDGRIVRFQEKPGWENLLSDTVNTGIYVLSPEVLESVPEDEVSDFSNDIFPKLLAGGVPMYGYVAEGYWCDIGDLREYYRANMDFLHGKINLPPPGNLIGDRIWVGQNVEIAPDARLYGPIYLGNEVKIKGGVEIHGPTCLRDGTIVDNGARVERSIIWKMAYIGEGAHLRGAIVGQQVVLKPNVILMDSTVVSDRTVIGPGAVIYSGVKIWPDKEVEAGASVRESLVWGQRGRRRLFGRFGITGMVNLDLTPEVAAKLGAAFASTLPKGSTVTINRDPHPSSRMLKRGVISGLTSAGVNVLDIRSVPVPVARYYTAKDEVAGGVHVRLSPFDQRVVDIRFFDGQGLDLDRRSEQQMERLYFRGDFRRAYLDDIGLISYSPDVLERYKEGFLGAINVPKIRQANHRVVVDYAHSVISQVLPDILNELGVETVPLNAYVDPKRMAILQDSFTEELRQMGQIVRALERAVGIRFDVAGEKLFMSDETGKIIPDRLLAATVAMIVMRHRPGCVIAVTMDQSGVFEEMAQEYGARVVRTGTNIRSLVTAAKESESVFGSDGQGSFVCGCFQAAPDALFMSASILEWLSEEEVSLSEIVSQMPPFHMAERTTQCPWEQKGLVMRRVKEFARAWPMEETEGVKVFLGQREWALIRPDPDHPTILVVAEGPTQERADALADEYISMVRGVLEA